MIKQTLNSILLIIPLIFIITFGQQKLVHENNNDNIKSEDFYNVVYNHSVISIKNIDKKGQLTAFYINNNYILSNAHGFKSKNDTIVSSDGNILEIINIDKEKDLALLKIKKINNKNYVSLNLCKNDTKVGENVYSVGYGQLAKTFKKGYNSINIIAQIGKSKTIGTPYYFDGNLKSGDSGSPVLKEKEHCLTGVVFAVSGVRKDIGFVIDLFTVKEFLKENGIK